MKGNNKVFSIFIVIIATVVSIGLYFIFIGNMTDVTLLNGEYEGGVQITSDMITTKKVDKSSIPNDYISADDANEIINGNKAYYLKYGQTANSVLTVSGITDAGNLGQVENGKVLYVLSNVAAYPTDISANSYLNVVVGYQNESSNLIKTIENVKVIAVNTETDSDTGAVTITSLEISVTPEDAQVLAYAQNYGTLSLSLVTDSYKVKGLPTLDSDGFLQSITKDSKNK